MLWHIRVGCAQAHPSFDNRPAVLHIFAPRYECNCYTHTTGPGSTKWRSRERTRRVLGVDCRAGRVIITIGRVGTDVYKLFPLSGRQLTSCYGRRL